MGRCLAARIFAAWHGCSDGSTATKNRQDKKSAKGLGKWLGYIDRYILFPFELRKQAEWADIVHICDHGNAAYTAFTGKTPTVVTCHDFLAVRGARGEDTGCPASFFGKFLQRSIVRGMERAAHVVCVSSYTRHDAEHILCRSNHLSVILSGINYPYKKLEQSVIDQRLKNIKGIKKPYILHVGSNLSRKNRDTVLRVVAALSKGCDISVVFAGMALNKDLKEMADSLGIEKRVTEVVKPDTECLEALYNNAALLLFPSRYEGFGWPPIEAQACGCPVIGSMIPPFIEVLGQSAALFEPDDVDGMVSESLRLLHDEEYRSSRCEQGIENVRMRFSMTRMIDEYLQTYKNVKNMQANFPKG